MDETRTSTPPAPPAGVQQPLPFDDEADRPIPYALTARARRTVAPEHLPPLTIVEDPPRRPSSPRRGGGGQDGAGTEDDAGGDTRPARARALRRAGLSVATIAARLAVDELLVRAWVGDVVVPAPVLREAARRGDRAVAAVSTRTYERFDETRRRAAAAAADRLREDADFAAGAGLLAALAEVDPHAVTVTSPHRDVVARVLTWLAAQAVLDRGRIRVVVRHGHATPNDVVRHRWAEALGLPLERVTGTRWPAAPAPDATEALVRVHDPVLAATVAGWRDALLHPPDHDPADVAF